MRIRWDGSGGDFYSRLCFSVVTEADAIFCWGIKEGYVNGSTRDRRLRNLFFNKLFPPLSSCVYAHMYEGTKAQKEHGDALEYSVILPTCPEEANRLMVVRSIQPRLVSSLWFTSRNWTIARLAASGGTDTHK